MMESSTIRPHHIPVDRSSLDLFDLAPYLAHTAPVVTAEDAGGESGLEPEAGRGAGYSETD
jgi:hypothetical protein